MVVSASPRYPRRHMAVIRRPTTDDAPRLGEVHVAAWQWAYRGQMPDDLLDSLRPESRAKAWKTWLSEESSSDFSAWVAEEGGDLRTAVLDHAVCPLCID